MNGWWLWQVSNKELSTEHGLICVNVMFIVLMLRCLFCSVLPYCSLSISAAFLMQDMSDFWGRKVDMSYSWAESFTLIEGFGALGDWAAVASVSM
jgi:hypothetical protein